MISAFLPHWDGTENGNISTSFSYFPVILMASDRLATHGARKSSSMALHFSDVIMGAMASQITFLTIVYSIGYSGADQRKHQSPASQAFVRRIHRWPVNSLQKWPVPRKMFPFDDVIMDLAPLKCSGLNTRRVKRKQRFVLTTNATRVTNYHPYLCNNTPSFKAVSNTPTSLPNGLCSFDTWHQRV